MEKITTRDLKMEEINTEKSSPKENGLLKMELQHKKNTLPPSTLGRKSREQLLCMENIRNWRMIKAPCGGPKKRHMETSP